MEEKEFSLSGLRSPVKLSNSTSSSSEIVHSAMAELIRSMLWKLIVDFLCGVRRSGRRCCACVTIEKVWCVIRQGHQKDYSTYGPFKLNNVSRLRVIKKNFLLFIILYISPNDASLALRRVARYNCNNSTIRSTNE